MAELLETKSVPMLLILVVVFLCAGLIKGIIEFLWKIKQEKDSVSETVIKELTRTIHENTMATQHLDKRLSEVEQTFSELPKLKMDMRKFYAAVKILSGDKWSDIRREMEEDAKL